MSAAAQARIEELLGKRLGLEVRSIGSRAIAAAVATRVDELGLGLDAYATFVDGDPAEQVALIDAVVVPESWFLRDRVPFSNLAAHARALLRGARARGPFRVLSAPCSTGEEPYSVAMAMLDAGLQPTEVVIEAIDVSEPLLAQARRGTYRAISFRGDELSYRDRYFHARGTSWELVEEVRAMVRFRQANLIAPGFLAGEPAFDAVLCRNLLIYLTVEARRTALTQLDARLAPGGVLVVGHAEALEVMDPRFRAIGIQGAFTYVRRVAPTADARGVPTPTPTPTPTPAVGPRRAITAPLRRAATPVLGTRALATAPGSTPPPEPAPAPPVAPPGDPLVTAAALADRGELARAAALCEDHLRDHGGEARAWSLLGTIRQAEGDASRAEVCFSRAIYCDPTHYASLVQLALLLDRRGDRDGATNLRRRAARAATEAGPR